MNEQPKKPPSANGSGDGTEISSAIQIKLMDTLAEQASSIITGQLGCVAAGLFCYFRTHQNWLLLWALSLCFLLIFRLSLKWSYLRNKKSCSPQVWAYRFTVGPTLTSVAFGLATATSVLQCDALSQMLLITIQGAYVTVAAVRNNALPRLATLQVIMPHLFLIFACIVKGGDFYIGFVGFVILHIVTVVQIVCFLYKKTLSLLLAEERAAAAAEALTEANARLQSLAATDQLTGVMNRRGFEIALANECGRAARVNEEFSLLLLDIDHFKMLNDNHGHQVGDDCLRQVGACLQNTTRTENDVAARYGGEEFVILLPKTNYPDAAVAAERVRAAIEAMAFPHPSSRFGVTTVSVGYATFQRGVLEDGKAIVKAADEALYYVKRTSRNAIAGCRDLEKPASKQTNVAAG